MIDGIIKWSLHNRLIIVLAGAALLLWGSYETLRMPVDVFPDLTAPTVTVMTEAHGMAPEEVETLVTFPIEAALNGASNVRRVRSSTAVGFSVVWVEFEWGVDIHRARQVVAEKLQLVSSSLPPEVDRPVLAPISSIMGEIMFLALTSDRHNPMVLRTLADTTIRRRVLAVSGVSQVIATGGHVRQLQVVLRPERLAAYGVTVDQVVETLSETNVNSSAGFMVEGGQEFVIRGMGRVQQLSDVAETAVTTQEGRAVLVRHLGDVRVGHAIARGTGSFNGSPAVVIGIQKQPGANTLELTERLDEVLDEIQATLPEGMQIHEHIFRQADFIDIAISNVTAALRDGAILVVIIVVLFLMSLRASGITVLAIPLSLVTAVVAMKALGETINTMTLGGMAIAVGALVDDAIIDVENVVRRLRLNAALPGEERRSTLTVVFEASKEIRQSIVFATFVIILVFLPLFFLSGVEGRLLRPLGFAYIISLFASLVVALTVTPVLCFVLLPRAKGIVRDSEAFLVRWLKGVYRPLLAFTVTRWKPVAAAAVAGLTAALLSLGGAGQAFLPDFNEGTLTLAAVTIPGTSLEESNRLGNLIEETLHRQPEVVATARRTGRAELDEHALGVNSAEIDVNLRMAGRSKEELLSALRSELSSVPGTNVIIGQPISHRIDHMLSGTRAAIAVKIFGSDLAELRRVAERVRTTMEDVEGVADLSVEQQADIPLISIRFDRRAIARHGLTIGQVSEAIEVAFGGHPVSRILEGQTAYDLVVRYDDESRRDLDALRATLIATPSGARIPLHALAAVERDLGPNTISREGVQRKIVVMSNVSGRDLRSVVEDVRRAIEANVELPEGYRVEYGGQFESAGEASRTLGLLGAAVVVGVFILLFIAFRSGRDAALVMVNLPLALIGGVAGVWFSGGVLSVASIIGFITLFGIATRNGLMLVSHIHHLVEHEGVTDPLEAVTRGAMERLGPILMTALASGLALVPLAMAGGSPGSEIQAPMAVVILSGLVSSTALNMLVVPALYLRFGSAGSRQNAPSQSEVVNGFPI
jgi:CzcA family heavy metal efflux pump